MFKHSKDHKEWFRIKTLLESKNNLDVKFKDSCVAIDTDDSKSSSSSDGDDEICINDCQAFLSLLNQRFHYQKWKVILQNKNKEHKNRNSSKCKADDCYCNDAQNK